jgi:hypothetical protein
MKRSDLNFKVVLGDEEREIIFLRAIGQPELYGIAVAVEQGVITGFATLKDFCNSPLPEMSLPEALRVIAQVEPVKPEKKGRWVKFVIREDGRFGFDGHDRWIDAPGCYSMGIFGGWLWKHEQTVFWNTHRQGVTESGVMTEIANMWERPLIPTKVRFWVEE